MQVPEPWQRNWVLASHTVVANAVERRKKSRFWLDNVFLLPERMHLVQGTEGRGIASCELCSVQPELLLWHFNGIIRNSV